jgi:hypothetical protein
VSGRCRQIHTMLVAGMLTVAADASPQVAAVMRQHAGPLQYVRAGRHGAALPVDVAAVKKTPVSQAGALVGYCNDPAVLAKIARTDARKTVLAAVAANNATPIASVIEVLGKLADTNIELDIHSIAQRPREERLEILATVGALDSLLYGDIPFDSLVTASRDAAKTVLGWKLQQALTLSLPVHHQFPAENGLEATLGSVDHETMYGLLAELSWERPGSVDETAWPLLASHGFIGAVMIEIVRAGFAKMDSATLDAIETVAHSDDLDAAFLALFVCGSHRRTAEGVDAAQVLTQLFTDERGGWAGTGVFAALDETCKVAVVALLEKLMVLVPYDQRGPSHASLCKAAATGLGLDYGDTVDTLTVLDVARLIAATSSRAAAEALAATVLTAPTWAAAWLEDAKPMTVAAALRVARHADPAMFEVVRRAAELCPDPYDPCDLAAMLAAIPYIPETLDDPELLEAVVDALICNHHDDITAAHMPVVASAPMSPEVHKLLGDTHGALVAIREELDFASAGQQNQILSNIWHVVCDAAGDADAAVWEQIVSRFDTWPGSIHDLVTTARAVRS